MNFSDHFWLNLCCSINLALGVAKNLVVNNSYVDAEEAGHSVKVVLVSGHSNYFWNHCTLGPLWPKFLHKFLQIQSCCFSNGKYCKRQTSISSIDRANFCNTIECHCCITMVDEPSHAESVEFLIKELNSKLASQQWHVFDDGQAHSPLGITGQLHNSWQQGL
jgi:hypothetical protein